MAALDPSPSTLDTSDPSDVVALCETLVGITPQLEPDYDLTRINPDERVQIRLDKNVAPREMVERFAYQMSFNRFPPIVVTQDNLRVDGSTRIAAKHTRGERFTPAYVIPISYQEAPPETKIQIEYLGQTLNNAAGKALDKAERRRMAKNGLKLGMAVRQVAQTVGFPDKTVRAIQREVEAELRMEQVGLPTAEELKLREAPLRALGKASDLNNQPYVELVSLAVDAGLNVGEITALAATVREVTADGGGDELALERIKRERDANAQRIIDRKQGGNGHPPANRALMQRLGFINGNRPASAMVEHNAEKMAEHLAAVEAAIERLTEVRDLQRAALAALPQQAA